MESTVLSLRGFGLWSGSFGNVWLEPGGQQGSGESLFLRFSVLKRGRKLSRLQLLRGWLFFRAAIRGARSETIARSPVEKPLAVDARTRWQRIALRICGRCWRIGRKILPNDSQNAGMARCSFRRGWKPFDSASVRTQNGALLLGEKLRGNGRLRFSKSGHC